MGWIEWFLWKIPTRLHGTNFCTTSARFAPSFVRQPNVIKCTQIICNTPKHESRVQWRGSGAFIAKNCDATSWHLLLQKFGSFWTECCNATICPKCTQIVWNAQKQEIRVQWGGSDASLQKIPTRLHGTNIFTTLARFAPSFVTQPNCPKMHPNSTKCTETWG